MSKYATVDPTTAMVVREFTTISDYYVTTGPGLLADEELDSPVRVAH